MLTGRGLSVQGPSVTILSLVPGCHPPAVDLGFPLCERQHRAFRTPRDSPLVSPESGCQLPARWVSGMVASPQPLGPHRLGPNCQGPGKDEKAQGLLLLLGGLPSYFLQACIG